MEISEFDQVTSLGLGENTNRYTDLLENANKIKSFPC